MLIGNGLSAAGHCKCVALPKAALSSWGITAVCLFYGCSAARGWQQCKESF